MNIVLDTNCLLMSLSRRSAYYPVWRGFVDGKYSRQLRGENERVKTALVDEDNFTSLT
ncbi:MAG: hypothetical protein ACSW8D_03990 [Prevotella sp.]